MGQHENLSGLISRLPYIESLFVTEFVSIARPAFKPPVPMKIKTIGKNPEYLSWKDEIEYELGLLPRNDTIDEIKKLFKKIAGGWSEDTDFQKLKAKLLTLDKHLDELTYVPNQNDYERQACNNVLKALITMQKNLIHKGKKEDELTDSLRDLLAMAGYEMKDQTRQGDSASGKNAGEVDLLHAEKGFPKLLIEAMCLASLDKKYIRDHIHKALVNYDPVGLPYVFIIVYYQGNDLELFWKKYTMFLSELDYEYTRLSPEEKISTGYAESRHCQVKLIRNEMEIHVHHYVVHLR